MNPLSLPHPRPSLHTEHAHSLTLHTISPEFGSIRPHLLERHNMMSITANGVPLIVINTAIAQFIQRPTHSEHLLFFLGGVIRSFEELNESSDPRSFQS